MTKLFPRTGAAVVALLVAVPNGAALAEGIPVYDNANTLQAIKQVANQLKELEAMAKDYAMQTEQYLELYKQTHAITGPRNMGSLVNSDVERELRRYLPDDLKSFIDLGASTIPSVSDASGIYNDHYSTYNPVTGAALDPSDPTGFIATSTDHLTGTTYGTLAASERAYDTITMRTQAIETMLARLNTTADLKESSDLTARLIAELALIENERLRLQAIQMQLAATQENSELMRLRQANEANVYDPVAAAASLTLKEKP